MSANCTSLLMHFGHLLDMAYPLTNILFHPGTNCKMVGFEIPNYQKLKFYIEKLCNVIPTARLIAWDIAVLENGFELIEANYEGDSEFMQAPSKQGKLKIIKDNL